MAQFNLYVNFLKPTWKYDKTVFVPNKKKLRIISKVFEKKIGQFSSKCNGFGTGFGSHILPLISSPEKNPPLCTHYSRLHDRMFNLYLKWQRPTKSFIYRFIVAYVVYTYYHSY